jgi:hypothetical protein
MTVRFKKLVKKVRCWCHYTDIVKIIWSHTFPHSITLVKESGLKIVFDDVTKIKIKL